DKFKPLIETLLAQGYKKWEIGNYWGLSVLPKNGIDLSFDAPLYMLNTQAMQMAKEMNAGRVTLSVEDQLDNLSLIAAQAPLPVTMVVYQDAALFTSAACIRSNACKDCPRGEKWLKLEKDGQKYQALSKDCQTMLFAEQPLCFAAEAVEIKVDYYRVDFVYKSYEAAKAAQVWNKVRRFEDVANCRKANLYRCL
ncbi:MAG: U32 family peptidase, partial [Alphaproteobacteria bacterium]